MPRVTTVAAVRPMVNYLVSGYWEQEKDHEPIHLATRGPDHTISVDLRDLNADGRALARAALDSWSRVADITFTEITGNRTAQITFSDDGASASTISDFGGPTGMTAATVNVGADLLDRNGARIGDFSFRTYIHEIGHALGLGHAGPYNGGTPRFPDGVLFDNDSWNLTVMSYLGQDQNPQSGASRAANIGPQIADILAIRQIYGAAQDDQTRGDTVWGKGSQLDGTLGDYFRAYYRDGVNQPAAVTFTIADAGGEDTINLSHHAKGQQINLAAGGVISAFGLTANIMVMPGTQIEHALSGKGDDKVWGNAAANRITTGTGDDMAWGKAGRDILTGDMGDDRLDGGGGNDRLDGGMQNDRVTGGAGADLVLGGTGDDVLSGGQGNDRLEGGRNNDRMTGGGGTDVFVFDGGDDVITDLGARDRLLIDGTLDRDGDLTLNDIADRTTRFDGDLVLELDGRGSLRLIGLTDEAAFLDRLEFL